MATSLDDVLSELKAVRSLLNRLLVPVEAEEARQVMSMSDDERKRHNKSVLKRAREKQNGRRVAA